MSAQLPYVLVCHHLKERGCNTTNKEHKEFKAEKKAKKEKETDPKLHYFVPYKKH